jgi:hypothetical protein
MTARRRSFMLDTHFLMYAGSTFSQESLILAWRRAAPTIVAGGTRSMLSSAPLVPIPLPEYICAAHTSIWEVDPRPSYPPVPCPLGHAQSQAIL